MKFPNPIPVSEIAERFSAKLIGDASIMVSGVNEIHKVGEGDLTFSDIEKYFKRALQSNATVIVLNQPTECPEGKALLIVDDPWTVYNTLIEDLRPFRPIKDMIDPSADIHPSAIVEPNVVIGPDVKIGADSHIQSGVIIREYSVIGDRVTIQSGTTIGTDAFYFKKEPEALIRWTSGGRVVIENDVHIGSNCTINRCVSGDTRVGSGTKIDSLVHIGHGAVVGKNCIIAGQVGISGNSTIGDNCFIMGQAGVSSSLKVGDNVQIHPQTGVHKDLETNKRYFGTPAKEWSTEWREIAAVKKLPELISRLEDFFSKPKED